MRLAHAASLMALLAVMPFVWIALNSALAGPAGGGQAAEHAAAPPPAEPAQPPEQAAPQESDISLITLIRRGGILMWPIGLCSVVALAFIIERLIRLRRSRVIPSGFLKALGDFLGAPQKDNGQGLQLCRANPSPVARIFEGAFRKAGRSPVEIEKAVEDAGEREVNRMKQNVRVLSTVANVAPLLGLLGTVFGMIRAFAKIRSEAALGKPELLASGIYEALVTTAAGLSVAIPSLVMFYYLSHKIDKMVREIDDLAVDVVEAVAVTGK